MLWGEARDYSRTIPEHAPLQSGAVSTNPLLAAKVHKQGVKVTGPKKKEKKRKGKISMELVLDRLKPFLSQGILKPQGISVILLDRPTILTGIPWRDA